MNILLVREGRLPRYAENNNRGFLNILSYTHSALIRGQGSHYACIDMETDTN